MMRAHLQCSDFCASACWQHATLASNSCTYKRLLWTLGAWTVDFSTWFRARQCSPKQRRLAAAIAKLAIAVSRWQLATTTCNAEMESRARAASSRQQSIASSPPANPQRQDSQARQQEGAAVEEVETAHSSQRKRKRTRHSAWFSSKRQRDEEQPRAMPKP